MIRLLSRILIVCTLFVSGQIYAFQCNTHVYYGIPGAADQLLCRDGYAVGYNYQRKVADWVAYRITKDTVSAYQRRSNKFIEDRELPEHARSKLSDYRGSGYDRGHLAPSATVDFSERSMQQSFLLTNMAPQLPGFNRNGWKHLEGYVRKWAKSRGDLMVVTGTLYGQDSKTIGEGVAVPSHFYKVVYDLQAMDAIAFLVPHENIDKKDIPGFITSVDEVERLSGMDFMNVLSDKLEDDMEDDIEPMWR